MSEHKDRESLLRVLVVDDDVVVGMHLSMGLPRVEILEASRSAEGLVVARARRPDVVIVDRHLPDGDGLDLVRSLRSFPETEAAVVITAGHDPNDRPEARRAGADEYVGKPFVPAELDALLRELLTVPPAERAKRRLRARRDRPLRAGEPPSPLT